VVVKELNYANRDLIRQHKMVPFLVSNLRMDNATLQAHSAMTIFKCAEDAETRRVVRDSDGLEPLVKLLSNTESTYVPSWTLKLPMANVWHADTCWREQQVLCGSARPTKRTSTFSPSSRWLSFW